MAKNAFTRKQELGKNFLSNNLKKMMVKVCVECAVVSKTRCLTAEDILRLEAIEMWIWRKIEKMKSRIQ